MMAARAPVETRVPESPNTRLPWSGVPVPGCPASTPCGTVAGGWFERPVPTATVAVEDADVTALPIGGTPVALAVLVSFPLVRSEFVTM
jgi:hypothetical protein